jgi:alpha-1,3-glucan synthase
VSPIILINKLPTSFNKGYSPLDFSVLDPHWGTIQDWRDTIDAVHAHGMYFMADFTVGTMGDLIGFSGCVPAIRHYAGMANGQFFFFGSLRNRHLNTSTPFSLNEYDAQWKSPNYMPWNFTSYRDFSVRTFPVLSSEAK